MHQQVKIVVGFVQNTKIIRRSGMTSFINIVPKGQYIPKIRLATASKLPVIFCLPYLGQYSLRVTKKLCNFLGNTNTYLHVVFGVVFQSTKRFENLSLSKITSLQTYVVLFFTSLRVVAARLLIMARHHTTLLFVVGNI